MVTGEDNIDSMLGGKHVADVFHEFAETVLNTFVMDLGYTEVEAIQQVLLVVWYAWNSVIMEDECGNTGHVTEYHEKILPKIQEEHRHVFYGLFDLKRRKFAQYRFLLGQFDFAKNVDGTLRISLGAALPPTRLCLH